MVWGSMSTNGVGNLAFIPTTMTKEVYLDILQNNVKPSARKLGMLKGFTFQQDKDPKHTAKVVQSWFSSNRVKVLDWPAQSPDLNPIEHLWNHLDLKIRGRPVPPTNKQQLEAALQEEWEKIDPNYTRTLVESIPRRIAAVIAAKGHNTKY